MNELDFFFGLALLVALAAAGSLVLSATTPHHEERKHLLQIFLWSIGVRFAVAVVIYQFGLVSVLGDEDSSGWFGGVILKREWERSGIGLFDLPLALSSVYTGQHIGYRYLLGALFYVTDSEGRMPAAALNCFFGAWLAVLVYRIARSLFSEWVATCVGWLICFFPSLIIWSAQTVKEPVVILLEAMALYGCVQLKARGFALKQILWCALAIALMLPFRFYAAYLAGVAVILTLAIPQMSKLKQTWGAMLGIGALVVPVILFSGVLARHEAQLEAFDLGRVQGFRRAISSGEGGASGVESSYNLENPPELALALAVGGAHLLLAPFPWQFGGASWRLIGTLPEALIWWWLFIIAVIPGLWFALRHRFRDIQAVLFFLFGLGMLYSLMFSNLGLAYRHRAQLLPLLLIFAAVGLEQRLLKRQAAQRAQAKMPMMIEVTR